MPPEAIVFPLAALFYTAAILSRGEKAQLKAWTLIVFSIGLALDTFGTVYVCVVRTGGDFMPTSIHGFAGYLAWLIMSLHFAWALTAEFSRSSRPIRNFHAFSDLAWAFWILAFFTGFPGLTGEPLVFAIVGTWVVYAVLRVGISGGRSLPSQA